MAELIK